MESSHRDRSAADAAKKLARVLRLAHAGELAATHAYRGHAASVSDLTERQEITAIMNEEIEHRAEVGEMLAELGHAPSRFRESVMGGIGRSISVLCYFGGWFIPMYGAGVLESRNVKEYEDAARYALVAGRIEWVEALLHMAEIEWDHEAYFYGKSVGHWMWKIFPVWKRPPRRELIRESFRAFEKAEASQ